MCLCVGVAANRTDGELVGRGHHSQGAAIQYRTGSIGCDLYGRTRCVAVSSTLKRGGIARCARLRSI
jgi:hypothetical protein